MCRWWREERGCVQVVEGGEGMCAGGGGRRGDVCRWWREERGYVQVVERGEGFSTLCPLVMRHCDS